MPQRPDTTFRKSCLAAAIAALAIVPSACSTLPASSEGAEPTDTRELGERNWDRVMYLLGFSEEAKRASRRAESGVPERPTLIDEIDTALMDEETVPSDPTPAAVGVDSLERVETAAAGEVVVVRAADEAGESDDLFEETIIDESALVVGSRDLVHEVGDAETLWDIAKATTGDATNWHVLADVNDLAPDASVYPGQALTIPADLVRPELADDAPRATGRPAVAEANDAIAVDTDVEPDGAPSAPTLAAAAAGTEFELEPGETLWDFAKRTTGDATNWRAIAEGNGFSDEQARRVHAGQTITVPAALVREPLATSPTADGDTTLESADVAASADERARTFADPTTDAAGAGPVETDASDDSLPDDVVAGHGGATLTDLPDVEATGPVEPIPTASAQTKPLSGTTSTPESAAGALPGTDVDTGTSPKAAGGGTLRIVEASYRGDEEGDVDAAAPTVTSGLPTEIMVSGTYYPKAVYNDADFSSSLLMRVSPGTTLQVSRAVGPWFEVLTEQGRGYMHTRDIK